MNIKIEISYTTNQFIFLSELSQWNDLICSIGRKKQILKVIGDLSEKEKELLSDFTKIFQESLSDPENIFLFEKEDRIWQKLKEKTKIEEFNQIKKIFEDFQDKFDIFWQKRKEELFQKEKAFKKNEELIDRYLGIIKSLCDLGLKQESDEILLKLIINLDENDCQSWAFKNVVVLESAHSKKENISCNTLNIFLHECFHIFLKRNEALFSKVKRASEKVGLSLEGYNAEVVFEEALVSSFLPEGCLGQKICKQLSTPKEKNGESQSFYQEKEIDVLTELRYFCAEKMNNLTKEYIEESKVLDDFFLEKIQNCLNSFQKGNRETI